MSEERVKMLLIVEHPLERQLCSYNYYYYYYYSEDVLLVSFTQPEFAFCLVDRKTCKCRVTEKGKVKLVYDGVEFHGNVIKSGNYNINWNIRIKDYQYVEGGREEMVNHVRIARTQNNLILTTKYNFGN